MLSTLLAFTLAASPGPDEAPDAFVQRGLEPARQASALGGATLGAGGTVALVPAGFPRLQAQYAQGLTDDLDVGAVGDADWLASELVAGGQARYRLATLGELSVSARGRLGLYRNFGATYALADNHGDWGAQLSGGLALTLPTGAGAFSLFADLPFTWTFARGQGAILAPRGGVAYETALFGDVSVGAQAGFGWRVASGTAPGALGGGRPMVDLLGVVTYRLL